MTFVVKDRVRDTCNTTGTGPYIVNGAPPNNFRSFSAVCILNDTIDVFIGNLSSNEWLVAKATYSGVNQLTIAPYNITDGVNGPGVAVSFSAGIKEVFGNVPAPNAWQRQTITGPRTYYISTTGNDNNDGLDPSRPFQTLFGAAVAINATIITNGWTITLQLADGTYPGGEYPFGNPGDFFTIIGNDASPGNVVFNNDGYACIDPQGPLTSWSAHGIKFNTTGGTGGFFTDANYITMQCSNCIFTGTGRFGMFAGGTFDSFTVGSFGTPSNITFDNFQGECALFSFQSSDWVVTGPSNGGGGFIFSGTVSFSNAFIGVSNNSNFNIFDPTFTGTTPTGQKYHITAGSNVTSNVTLPGTLAGVIDDNSVYNFEGLRHVLVANRTYFVRTNGNDQNDGLSNTAGGAFLTFAHAFAVVAGAIDFAGHTVTISMQNATWTVPFVFNSPTVGGGFLVLELNGSTIAITSGVNNCIDVTNCPTAITVQNYTLSNSVAGGLNAGSFSNVTTLGNNTYGAVAAGTPKIGASATSSLDVEDTVTTITAGGNFAILSNGPGAQLYFYPASLVLTGTPAYSRAFALSQGLAYIEAFQTNTVTTGSATGPRYEASLNAVIQTFGSGANNFPGNAAGSTPTGGQYT